VAESLGQAVLTLTVDDKQFNAGLNRAKQKAEGAFATVKGPNLGGALGAIASGLSGAAVSAAAVAAAVAGIGFAATQSAGQVQKLTAAFTGLTGSAEAAAQLQQTLFDLSKTTPFKDQEIQQAAQRFLAVGISADSLSGSINRIGALAAQSGQPLERLGLIYAQVFAKGRLQGEENLQFLEAGVDLSRQLTEVTGLSGRALQDAMSKGKIGIDAVNAAIILATGEMKALTEAGKSVDTRFNNIFDNLGKLFAGFAKGVEPILSAAFGAFNRVFEAAFPNLESITIFFGPLTLAARRFSEALEDTPGVIEVIAGGLRSLGEVVINNLADGILFVSNTLENIDQEKFIQGFINAEIAVRRVFLAASALGAQLVKNAELSFRAIGDPGKFFQDITRAGGFGKFIEDEYQLVERKWKDWANSEPLEFPDLTGQGAKQADTLAGDLDNKLRGAGTELAKKIEDAAAKLKEAAIEGANAYIQAIQKLTESRLQLAELRGKPEGLNRFLSGQEQFDRTRNAIISLGPELNQALEQGASLLRSQGVGIGRELFGDLRAIFDNAVTGRSANQEGLLALTQFIRDVQTERGAEAGVNQAERDLAEVQRGLITSNIELREAVSALVQKDWNVQVNLNGATGASVIGDVAGALG
jgi:tape measure domain-containing protein